MLMRLARGGRGFLQCTAIELRCDELDESVCVAPQILVPADCDARAMRLEEVVHVERAQRAVALLLESESRQYRDAETGFDECLHDIDVAAGENDVRLEPGARKHFTHPCLAVRARVEG